MSRLLASFILIVCVLGVISDTFEESDRMSSDRDWARRQGHSDHDSRHTKQHKRQKKIQRRKQRQERREERRRHRPHGQDADLPGGVPLFFAGERSPGSNPAGGGTHFPLRQQPGFGISAPPLNNGKSIADMPWLENNITSIWLTLQHIQKDLKQMRRQFRANNQNKALTDVTNSFKLGTSTEEPCWNPYEEVPRNTCVDSKGLTCGKVGKCVCGQCVCESPYYGMNCQCNDLVCHMDGGVMCGGAGRGQCRCGKCVCRAEFTGSACECSLSIANCQRDNYDLCSGAGSCICNRCQCNDGYYGKYCDENIYSAGVCERLKPCVLCLAYGKQYPQCEDCNIKVEIVKELESSSATCVMVNLGCILKYSYEMPTSGGTYTVLVLKDTSCRHEGGGRENSKGHR